MSVLMVQGTGSDVGKSLIVAGLCRAFTNRGMNVRPFKPQNMSNNAAVTSDGGEIGRAQALQAIAAKVPLSVHMNPVLLKPETTTGSQIIVQGKRAATMTAREYFKTRQQYMPAILESFNKLQNEADLVIVEGAGSPAEVNLRNSDLANMGFAQAVSTPVLLVGDIHRGGVIASLVGTKTVLPAEDANLIKAFLINNFHGDTSLFDDGLKIIEEQTGWLAAGVIPHFEAARKLPPEDALALDNMEVQSGSVKIAVPRLARIANFDDLDPLRLEPDVNVEIVQPGNPLPGDADLVLLPGSKATISDLEFFSKQGWDIDLAAHIRRGGKALGLCGGYQMLGKKLHDPEGIEGPPGSADGLGYLDVETTMTADKSLVQQKAQHTKSGLHVDGYEMHLGYSTGPDCERPFAHIGERSEGATSASEQVAGTYLHGIFSSDDFRRAFLKELGAAQNADFSHQSVIEETLDGLAVHLEEHIDLDTLLAIAKEGI